MATDLFGEEIPKAESKVDPFDFYPTPHEMWRAILERCIDYTPTLILDPGAGDGQGGQEARKLWPSAHIVGVELDNERHTPHPAYDDFIYRDFLRWHPDQRFDLILSNPPYSNPSRDIAEGFVHKARTLLTQAGKMVFIVRAAFTHSQGRWDRIFRDYQPELELVSIRRPSFYYELTGSKDTNSEDYTILVWGRDGADVWKKEGLDWDYDPPQPRLF